MKASEQAGSLDRLPVVPACRALLGARARQVRVGWLFGQLSCREQSVGSVRGERGGRVGCGAASERDLDHNRRSSSFSSVLLTLAGAHRENVATL